MGRTVRGVGELYRLDPATLRSAEALWVAENAGRLHREFGRDATLALDGVEKPVAGPASAFGVYWTGEGLGIPWPGQDLALLVFVLLFLGAGMLGAATARPVLETAR